MRKLKNIISLIVLGFSTSLFAAVQTVELTGEPVVLQSTDNNGTMVYTLPADAATTTTAYHYVKVNDTNRVCYATTQTDFGTLDMVTINVNANGTTSPWYCYAVQEPYFKVVETTTTTTTPTTTTVTTP